MKKLFALLVVAGMVFFSCGSTNTEPETAVNEEAEVEATVEEQVVEDAVEMDAEEAPEAEVAE